VIFQNWHSAIFKSEISAIFHIWNLKKSAIFKSEIWNFKKSTVFQIWHLAIFQNWNFENSAFFTFEIWSFENSAIFQVWNLKFQKKMASQQFSTKRVSTFSQLIIHSRFFHSSQSTTTFFQSHRPTKHTHSTYWQSYSFKIF
jgi:hypothetical protein